MYPMPQYGHGGWSRGFSLPPGGIAGIRGLRGDAISTAVGTDLLASAKAAGPVVGPFIAIAGAIADIVGLFGPNPDNTITTGYVNQIEADIMKPNLAAWQSLPASQKTIANQMAAEAIFNAGWNQVLSLCENPALGSSGTSCIADRERGGKYSWFGYYLDPIANDPAPAANAALAAEAAAATTSAPTGTTVTTTTNGVTTTTTTPVASSPNLYLWGGLGLLGLVAVLAMGGD